MPAEEIDSVGIEACYSDQLQVAERAWRRAADAGHHHAESNLGFTLADRGEVEEAECWLRRAADAGDHNAGR